jgi:mediator of RNA polymerase II transcription subunit 21
MTDRLTQLQVCLDQLVAQFNATINYVNANSEPAELDGGAVFNIAVAAPLAGAAPEDKQSPTGAGAPPEKPSLESAINELSTDIILKSRQLSMLIDLLPGIGVSPTRQLAVIEELARELEQVEHERIQEIKKKDELLAWCESLIMDVSNGISKTQC